MNYKEEMEKLNKNYLVLKEGIIINRKTNKEVIFSKDQKGYLKARLYTDLSNHKDKRKPYRLHRIIAMFYLNNFSKELQVNHIDGNKLNNNVNNLEMVTCSENMKHSYDKLNRKCNLERNSKGQFTIKK